jgi:hypothetical protein
VSFIIFVVASAWIFYRVFIEKTFLFWTWKDGKFRNQFKEYDDDRA